MKKLLLIPLIVLLPASVTLATAPNASAVPKSSVCGKLKDEAKKYRSQIAAAQVEVSEIKVFLVDLRQGARRLTNEYHAAKRRAKKAVAEYQSNPSPENARKARRALAQYQEAKERSLEQGRRVNKAETALKQAATKLRTNKRALEAIKKELKRNNCK